MASPARIDGRYASIASPALGRAAPSHIALGKKNPIVTSGVIFAARRLMIMLPLANMRRGHHAHDVTAKARRPLESPTKIGPAKRTGSHATVVVNTAAVIGEK